MNCSATPKSPPLSRAMTACRSSRFLLVTRSWSPWICACTPLGPSSRIFLLIALALSESIPWMILQSIRYVLPDTFGSPASSDLSEMFRLTSFSLNTSSAARARSSVSACTVIALSPAWATCAPVPRKSNRVASSFDAWLSALSSSCRSTLLTMSNEGSATSPPSGSRLTRSGVPTVPVCAPPVRYRYPCLRCRTTVQRYPHGGLPERSMGTVCKTVAKATKVRTLHPPHTGESARDQRKRWSRAELSSPVESGRIRPTTASGHNMPVPSSSRRSSPGGPGLAALLRGGEPTGGGPGIPVHRHGASHLNHTKP